MIKFKEASISVAICMINILACHGVPNSYALHDKIMTKNTSSTDLFACIFLIFIIDRATKHTEKELSENMNKNMPAIGQGCSD